jgi:hypothetical protein
VSWIDGDGRLAGATRRAYADSGQRRQLLLAAADRDGIAPHDVGALADLFRRAPDSVARAYVLDHPADTLVLARRKAEKPGDPRLTEAGQELLTSLTTHRQISLRIARRAREGLGELPPDVAGLLGEAMLAAERDAAHAIAAARSCLAAT